MAGGDEEVNNRIMPKYVIECDMPGAGNMTRAELQKFSQKFCDVLLNLGPEVQWIHSYVTGNKIYCLYYAPGETLIREHARQSGFSADTILEVKAVIDPATAEA